jgi:diamine N-acetyltransferase
MMTDETLQPGSEAAVALRKITQKSLRIFLKMSVAESQTGMVAPNSASIAEAYFEKYAWFRGIYADETAVGFLMLYDNLDEPIYFLWRMMIAEEYQGVGYGRKAVDLLIDYVKTRPNATELLVSHIKELPGNPGPFYQKVGFEYTGEEDDGELMMKLTF